MLIIGVWQVLLTPRNYIEFPINPKGGRLRRIEKNSKPRLRHAETKNISQKYPYIFKPLCENSKNIRAKNL